MNDEIVAFDDLRRLREQLAARPTCQHVPVGSNTPCGLPAEYECDHRGGTRPRYVCREHLAYQQVCVGRVALPPESLQVVVFNREGGIVPSSGRTMPPCLEHNDVCHRALKGRTEEEQP